MTALAGGLSNDVAQPITLANEVTLGQSITRGTGASHASVRRIGYLEPRTVPAW